MFFHAFVIHSFSKCTHQKKIHASALQISVGQGREYRNVSENSLGKACLKSLNEQEGVFKTQCDEAWLISEGFIEEVVFDLVCEE